MLAKSACPVGHKIVVTNLEPFVTTEDITVCIECWYGVVFVTYELNTFVCVGTFFGHGRFIGI